MSYKWLRGDKKSKMIFKVWMKRIKYGSIIVFCHFSHKSKDGGKVVITKSGEKYFSKVLKSTLLHCYTD